MKLAKSFDNLSTYCEANGVDTVVAQQVTELKNRLSKLGFFFISNALSEEISLGDSSEQVTALADAMDEHLQWLPSQVLDLTASLTGFAQGRLDISEILTAINERVETLLGSVKDYYGEFSQVNDQQRSETNAKLTEEVETALGDEEKAVKNGVVIIKKKESTNSIFDTQIHWDERSSGDAEVTISNTYIFIDGQWWYRESRHRITNIGGYAYFMPEESRSRSRRGLREMFAPRQFNLDGETETTLAVESEQSQKARQSGFELASGGELNSALQKINEQK